MAQCPDGTPPPCARGARPAVAIDPNRIAVLPFRVTTADSLLGEGAAELLAAEFTGDHGPRAVNMGTVIRAWRAAGGGPRSPLAQTDQIRAARAMGAGLVVDGSIVGLGQRLTLSASVVSVMDGRSRRATPVSGSADSIDVLLRRFTMNLIAAVGGEARATERGVLTESPVAMRAYLEGLSSWRRYDVAGAAAAFERAFAEDSTFARAAMMRYVAASWGAGSQPLWANRVWALLERLSPPDRLMLKAVLGDNYPVRRTPEQVLRDRELASSRLPESPEAQYFLGDWLFHYGATANVENAFGRAIQLFQRSLALDSQETVLSHLVDAAIVAGDTTLLRELRPVIERIPVQWATGWVMAGMLGDNAWLERLRHQPRLGTPSALALAAYAGVGNLVEEGLDLFPRTGVLSPTALFGFRYYGATVQGRSSLMRRVLASAPPGINRDLVVLLSSAFSQGDTAAGREAADRLANPTGGREDERAAIAGDVAMWRLVVDGSATWDDSSLARSGNAYLSMLLHLVRDTRAGTLTDAQVAAADSSARMELLAQARWIGIENLLLMRAWEARGDNRRALAASRLRPFFSGVVWTEAVGPREEGRLALQLGDTTTALRAWKRYLLIRKDAEGALAAERDSVRALVTRLEHR